MDFLAVAGAVVDADGRPAHRAEQVAAAGGADVRAGHAGADAGVVRRLARDHLLGELGAARQVRHGLDQVREVFERLRFVGVGQLDQAAFLQGV